MLKFENTAEVGDIVKCYDFEPFVAGEEHYVIGRVVEKGMFNGVKGYAVEVSKDTVYPEDPREKIVAPFEVKFLEWNGRIEKVAA